MGFIPRAHQVLQMHKVPELAKRSTYIDKLQLAAQTVIRKAQKLMAEWQGKNFTPYKKGDKVWLKGTNITMTHPTSKLAPRQHGPFKITKVVICWRPFRTLPQYNQGKHWRPNSIYYCNCVISYTSCLIVSMPYGLSLLLWLVGPMPQDGSKL